MACVLTVTANPLLNFVTDTAVSPRAVNRVRGCAVSTEGKGVNVARVLADRKSTRLNSSHYS